MLPGHALPPQITDISIESCAIHSQSQGWLPGMTFRILTTDPSVALVASIVVGPATDKIRNDIRVVANRANLDVQVAKDLGQIS